MDSEALPNPPGGPDAPPLASAGSDEGASPPPLASAPSPLPEEVAPPAPSPPASVWTHAGLPARPPSIVFLVVVTAASLAADLVTKGWAKQNLAGFDPAMKGARRLTILKDHVDFIFAQNPGGAWSFLRSVPDTLRRPFFLLVSAAAIVFIVSIYRRLHPDQRAMKWGLPLALGGAMGNLVDRIRYGWVVDFVDVYLNRGGRPYHWPTFNVADIAIVIGVGLMAISMLSSQRPKEAQGLKGEPAAPPAG